MTTSRTNTRTHSQDSAPGQTASQTAPHAGLFVSTSNTLFTVPFATDARFTGPSAGDLTG